MFLLRKVNYILAIIGIGLAFSHFFIEAIQIPTYIFPLTAIVISLAVIKELFHVLGNLLN